MMYDTMREYLMDEEIVKDNLRQQQGENTMTPDFITEYIVWVGGSEQGQYSTLEQAEEVWEEWRDDGYRDVEIEEIEVPNETPGEVNAWLHSGGW